MSWSRHRVGLCLATITAAVAFALILTVDFSAEGAPAEGSRVGGGNHHTPDNASQGSRVGRADPDEPDDNEAPDSPGETPSDPDTTPDDKPRDLSNIRKPDPALVARVIAIQNRHNKQLIAVRGVVGVATGLSKNGGVVILVFTENRRPPQLPAKIEGIPVEVEFTGPIRASQEPSVPRIRPSQIVRSPHAFHERPVPAGVSIGPYWPEDGSNGWYGTLGCRVKDRQGNVYILSNNHVIADNGVVPIGTAILQPGMYDPRNNFVGLRYGQRQTIGHLSKYVPMRMDAASLANPNLVDAAIAKCTTRTVDNVASPGGYGAYTSSATSPYPGQPVQKYAATTGLTREGVVVALNGAISVDYGAAGVGYFERQIVIFSTERFTNQGDSGSLIVSMSWPSNTRMRRRVRPEARHPLGLFYANNVTGTWSFANPIKEVLKALDVTIDAHPAFTN